MKSEERCMTMQGARQHPITTTIYIYSLDTAESHHTNTSSHKPPPHRRGEPRIGSQRRQYQW